MTTTEADKKRLINIEKKLDSFISQYDTDMRGDTNSANGKHGMVNDVRTFRRDMAEVKYHIQNAYPSLTYLFATKPIKTIGVTLFISFVVLALYSAGIINLVAKIFGFDIPNIIS